MHFGHEVVLERLLVVALAQVVLDELPGRYGLSSTTFFPELSLGFCQLALLRDIKTPVNPEVLFVFLHSTELGLSLWLLVLFAVGTPSLLKRRKQFEHLQLLLVFYFGVDVGYQVLRDVDMMSLLLMILDRILLINFFLHLRGILVKEAKF